MIVDCHTHIFESGRGGPFNAPSSADDLVRQLDASGVDAAIVLPLPGVATNRHVRSECERHRDRLFALYTPEFDAPSSTIQRMERHFADTPAHGLKIHPRNQGVSVEVSIVDEVIAWAAERSMTILFDVFAWGDSLGNTAMEPFAYNAAARRYPTVRILLAHAGGQKVLDAFLVAKSNPNVFVDVSFTPLYFKGSSIERDVGFICGALPDGRVLYGSDFPYTHFQQHLDVVRELTRDLGEERQAAIFGGAARELFHLP